MAESLSARGFTSLTPVQEAVLDPAFQGRDLRVFSQTGSGKTVAVGLAIAPDLERVVEARRGAERPAAARPFALIVAPTRELATQIAAELSWLYAPIGVEVAAVTGGASYARELAALRRGPLVIAGTPGRLVDHLGRGRIDPSAIGVVVLDEADQMLDLGFRDELEAILDQTPPERRTILLSATFPREVQHLADRCQRDPLVAVGAGAGQANLDIAHVAHLVAADERLGALKNLLLMAPSERALVFVRTREGASEVADALSAEGLRAMPIHGDLDQRERTRALDAFRSGAVTTLVATDVAARGIDVAEVGRVIHLDLPSDAEVLTHRSGRTGRAGRKGTNVLLVPPAARERARMLLRRARIEAVWAPVPSAADVRAAADERLLADLAPSTEIAMDPRLSALAERLLAGASPVDVVASLLARVAHAGPCAPAEITPIAEPAPRARRPHPAADRVEGRARRAPASPRAERVDAPVPAYADAPPARRPAASRRADRVEAPAPSDAPPARRPAASSWADRGDAPAPSDAPPARRPAASRPAPVRDARPSETPFVPFQINWGVRHGADPRRLLAMVCRRGGIRGDEVGAIRIGEVSSTFEVAAPVAKSFARSVKKPDARDPKIRIEMPGERPERRRHV
jgi:ATP-dependent RNA helicase DeaD